MERMKYFCLYCGSWLEARSAQPQERQCSTCRRRKGIISEQEYLRGIEVAKNILRLKKPKVPFLQAIEDISDILAQTFPNPIIPGKTLICIIKKAQVEIKQESDKGSILSDKEPRAKAARSNRTPRAATG